MNNIVAGAIGLAFILVVMVFLPLAPIWALNTLFPMLAIPYNFWTWLAVMVLAVFSSSFFVKRTN